MKKFASLLSTTTVRTYCGFSICNDIHVLWCIIMPPPLYKCVRTWPFTRGCIKYTLDDIHNPSGSALVIMNIILVYISYTTRGHVLTITYYILYIYYNYSKCIIKVHELWSAKRHYQFSLSVCYSKVAGSLFNEYTVLNTFEKYFKLKQY